MSPDRPVLGILLMLGFCILAPLGDGMAKRLGETIPVFQLVTVRFAVQAAILLPFMVVGARRFRTTGRVFALTALRTVLHILGISMMFLALRYLPLADAIAIAFVMPFIMLLLGWFFLSEVVGARRFGACVVGFAGTLMVMQPSLVELGPTSPLPLSLSADTTLF